MIPAKVLNDIVIKNVALNDKRLSEALISTRNGLITDIAIKMLSNKSNTINL